MGVPPVEELKHLVQKLLAEGEKIPIAVDEFASLLSNSAEDWCSEHDLNMLFTIGKFPFHLTPVLIVIQKPSPDDLTESGFVSFWDSNICDIVSLLVLSSQSTHNTSHFTSTGWNRPNFAFIIDYLCPFRGEEKGPGDTKSPRKELIKKLMWTYHPAPYVLAYCCYGSHMMLMAITAPMSDRENPGLEDIVTIDLRRRKDCITNICHLINLLALLHPLASLVQPPTSH
ncbi:hypothetical protein BKA82DRAFT_4355091 [Pisolithus tinctorius]|nr:hypothetical protein BKA82DRAFT_4355091 [Pisolithus tinctorius]